MTNKLIKSIKSPNYLLLGLLKRIGVYVLSDKWYLKCRYRLEMGEPLNLKNPNKFTEKLQWLKLYDRKPEYTTMVDKYAVKKYVEEKIGKEYIIPTLGVWDTPEDIDFDGLPERFVLKTTNGGGGGGVIICKDRASFDKAKAIEHLRVSLKSDIYRILKEWPYKNVPPRIIAEQYMEDSHLQELRDYKFFCFNGVPIYCQVIADRSTRETIDFFDMKWNHMEFVGLNPRCGNAFKPASKPASLSQMIEKAVELSKGISFLRVDFYNVNDKVYFGEMTFYPASGFGVFTPDVWNIRLGEMLAINN